MAGKRFLAKYCRGHCVYPVGQKFRQNLSILHYLRDAMELQTIFHLIVKDKVAEQHILGKYSN